MRNCELGRKKIKFIRYIMYISICVNGSLKIISK